MMQFNVNLLSFAKLVKSSLVIKINEQIRHTK